MRVMVLITRGLEQCFIMDIMDKRCGGRLRRLIDGGRYTDAIVETLSGGVFVEEIRPSDMQGRNADLIVTEYSAHWDNVSARDKAVDAAGKSCYTA